MEAKKRVVRISDLWSVRVWGFPVALEVKNLPASAGDRRAAGSVPGLGSSP